MFLSRGYYIYISSLLLSRKTIDINTVTNHTEKLLKYNKLLFYALPYVTLSILSSQT